MDIIKDMPKGKKGFQKKHPVYGGFKTRFKKGNKPLNPFKKGHTPWNKGLDVDKQPFAGKTHTKETKLKMRQVHLGKNNPAWKGEFASYSAFHAWVKQHKGKPQKCVDCGTTKGKIEWSNIDHTYKRKLEDYQSRCVSCHRKYDEISR